MKVKSKKAKVKSCLFTFAFLLFTFKGFAIPHPVFKSDR